MHVLLRRVVVVTATANPELEDALTDSPLTGGNYFTGDVPDLLGVFRDSIDDSRRHLARHLASALTDWAHRAIQEEEDRQEFYEDLIDALKAGEDARTVLLEWAATGQALADPKRRQVLLGEAAEDDFVEVQRPER